MSDHPHYRDMPESGEGPTPHDLGEPVVAPIDSVVSATSTGKSRGRLLLAGLAAVVLLVGAIGVLVFAGGGGDADQTTELSLEENPADPPTGEAELDTGGQDSTSDDQDATDGDSVRTADASRTPLPRADEAPGTNSEIEDPGLALEPIENPEPVVEEPTSTTAAEAEPTAVADPPPAGITEVAYATNEVMMVFDRPDERVSWALPNPTQFGGPRVVTVLGTTPDKAWHKVSVPVQPNGTVGWVRAEEVRIETHEFRAQVALGSRRVQVWDGERLVTDTGAVIGKSTTPTPLGTFFVRDIIPQSYSGGAYGPWILALSGFSEAMDTFDGGLPAIAVHGTNRPDLLGSAASNGCIRIPNDIVTLLAETVPLGTKVDVVA